MLRSACFSARGDSVLRLAAPLSGLLAISSAVMAQDAQQTKPDTVEVHGKALALSCAEWKRNPDRSWTSTGAASGRDRHGDQRDLASREGNQVPGDEVRRHAGADRDAGEKRRANAPCAAWASPCRSGQRNVGVRAIPSVSLLPRCKSFLATESNAVALRRTEERPWLFDKAGSSGLHWIEPESPGQVLTSVAGV